MNQLLKRKNHLILAAILAVSFIIAGTFVFLTYRTYFWTAFLSLIFYISTRSYYNQLKSLMRPKYSAFVPWIMILIIITVILLPSFLVIKTLINQTLSLLYQFKIGFSEEKIISTILQLSFFTDMITDREFFWVQLPLLYQELIGDYIDILNIDSLYDIVSNASSFILGSIELPLGILVNLVIAIILLFFLYKEGHRMEAFLINAIPFPRIFEEKIGRRISQAIEVIIKGNLFISFLQGMFIYVLLLIAGINNPFLYASVAAIFSLIPIIGTSVVYLPAGIYLFIFENSPGIAIFIVVAGLSAYLLLENIIKPKLLDQQLNIHPLILFLSLIGGIQEFGIAGLIIGPVSVTVIVILWDFIRMYNKGEFEI